MLVGRRAAEQVTRCLLETGITESVTGLLQFGGNHALAGAREFARALVPEQQPRPERWDRQHRWSAQDVREGAGVVGVANRFWGNRIHRPDQLRDRPIGKERRETVGRARVSCSATPAARASGSNSESLPNRD